jgi:hypothetical protein
MVLKAKFIRGFDPWMKLKKTQKEVKITLTNAFSI